jgi:TonB family protein
MLLWRHVDWRNFSMKRAITSILAISGLMTLGSFGYCFSTPDTAIYDKDMRVIDFEDLKYPAIAHSAHIEGVVVIRVELDDEGKVAEALPISGTESLIISALANAKKWRFEPNSKRAAVLVYDFRIEGFCRDNSESGQSIYRPPNFTTITACGKTAVP